MQYRTDNLNEVIIMATKKLAVPAVLTINSLKDAAYQGAKSEETLELVAKYVLTKAPDFAENQEPEVVEKLSEGWNLRYSELYPDVEHVRLSDSIVPVANCAEMPEKPILLNIGVAYATSFTTHDMIAMGNPKSKDGRYDPALKAVVEVWREKAKKYRDGRKRTLINKIKSILNEGKERTRPQAFEFDESVSKFFNDPKTGLHAKCKARAKRGDPTANEKKLIKAIAAFNAVWKHQD